MVWYMNCLVLCYTEGTVLRCYVTLKNSVKVLCYTEETNLFCVSAVSRTEGGELLCDNNIAVNEGIGF